ncbi:hypothetical protein Q8A67_012783 [Cirrhinus molitorella]|uniref:Uncharacterized protein n=1 Tax=Cirrhinus molitorella TaxID=172907 RepID=A0AA88PS30_9TELE|nr:hypothetical protein Q8A67_012783 [Cirrhinus molitorella]
MSSVDQVDVWHNLTKETGDFKKDSVVQAISKRKTLKLFQQDTFKTSKINTNPSLESMRQTSQCCCVCPAVLTNEVQR